MITNSSLPSERYVCRIGLLERLPLRTPYPSIAARIIDIVRRLPHDQTTVIVDPTGAHAAYGPARPQRLRSGSSQASLTNRDAARRGQGCDGNSGSDEILTFLGTLVRPLFDGSSDIESDDTVTAQTKY